MYLFYHNYLIDIWEQSLFTFAYIVAPCGKCWYIAKDKQYFTPTILMDYLKEEINSQLKVNRN